MENQYKTETRIFDGNNALDGFAGFRRRQSYDLRYQVLENGDVAIELDHVQRAEGQAPVGPAIMSFARFKEWFVKV